MAYDCATNVASTPFADGSGFVPPPEAPTLAVATQTEKDTNTLTWTDNSGGVATGSIEANYAGAGFNEIGTVAAGVTTFDDTPVAVGVECEYRVRALGVGGYSDYATASPVTPTYVYGYPAFGSSAKSGTPFFQLLFDEVSGNLVDEVGGYTFVNAGTAATYGVTASGNYAGVSPGVTIGSATTRFKSTSVPDIGTSDWELEFWFKTTDSTNENVMWSYDDGAGHFGYFSFRPPTGKLNFVIRTTDGTTVSGFILCDGTNYNDGVLHKGLITFDRDADITAKIDTTVYGALDMSSLNGKTIGNANMYIGNDVPADGNFPFHGTYFEFRGSLNLTNQSGGN